MESIQIHLIGTGTAFHAGGRGSACTLLVGGAAEPVLVDIGPTAVAAAQGFGIDLGRIGHVFITHLHGDHIAGWPFLLLNLALCDRRSRRLQVHGPPGCREALEGLARICYGDLLASPRLGFQVSYQEIPVHLGIHRGFSPPVDVVPVDHHPSSLGYRFRLGRHRVAVTGDTRWCGGLEVLARDSDVLILECTSVEPGEGAHLSLSELRGKIDRLKAGRFVLVHPTDDVAADLAKRPIPGVIAARDGMVIEL